MEAHRSHPYLNELEWRGMLYQRTEAVGEALHAGTVAAYAGFDPTAPSLHVGHLLPVMGLMHFQRHGHRPIALVGGGTGLIGDPSGRSSERQLLSPEATRANVLAIRTQLERFLDFDGPIGAQLVDNAEWLADIRAIDFLRDVGKHFTVNYMLQKDAVQSRMEAGISYTEFSYMLLQAYDYLELHRRRGVTLQMGGSDQWGNITAGSELIRRTTGGEAHAITFPLVTSSTGAKFGKTEGNAVWLDPAMTSSYKFFQFWINVDDRDVARYLRYFTLISRGEIEELDAAIASRPQDRMAQRALARDVTTRVHGRDPARTAEEVSDLLFGGGDSNTLSAAALEALRQEIPTVDVTTVDVVAANGGPSIASHAAVYAHGLIANASPAEDAAVAPRAVLFKSRADAKRTVQQGGVYLNGQRATVESAHIRLLQGEYVLVRKGARSNTLLRFPREGHRILGI